MNLCTFCSKQFTVKGLKYHEMHCTNNPNRLIRYASDETKAKISAARLKCSTNGMQGRKHSDETKALLRSKRLGKTHTEEAKTKLRNLMKANYAAGKEYGCGRAKKYKHSSPIAGEVNVDGTWELKFCEFADRKGLKWYRNFIRFDYINLKDKQATYRPDFYIDELKAFIEVKGYETDLDRCKWSQFPEKLLIVRLKDIGDLDEWLKSVSC